jgi:hypothetical protein
MTRYDVQALILAGLFFMGLVFLLGGAALR